MTPSLCDPACASSREASSVALAQCNTAAVYMPHAVLRPDYIILGKISRDERVFFFSFCILYRRHFPWVSCTGSAAGAAQPIPSDGYVGRYPLESLLKCQRQGDHGVLGGPCALRDDVPKKMNRTKQN